MIVLSPSAAFALPQRFGSSYHQCSLLADVKVVTAWMCKLFHQFVQPQRLVLVCFPNASEVPYTSHQCHTWSETQEKLTVTFNNEAYRFQNIPSKSLACFISCDTRHLPFTFYATLDVFGIF